MGFGGEPPTPKPVCLRVLLCLVVSAFRRVGSRSMLARGYVAAATDCPGLGAPETHPYLVGDSRRGLDRRSLRGTMSTRELRSAMTQCYEIDACRPDGDLKHMRKILSAVTGVALLVAPTMGSAFPLAPPHWQSSVTLIANGCGGGRYRGPGGACHRFGYGPYPGGAQGSYARDHGCGVGRYRGPGGACHVFGHGPYPHGYFGPYH